MTNHNADQNNVQSEINDNEVNNEIKETKETAWCPGCGNFPLRKALIKALNELQCTPEEVVMFTGIGQAAKMPHYININGFNGLHGRSIPPAIGMRVANYKLNVIVESGDGCTYGEGGNHFLHNIRRNPDITHLVHNNQIYGLTKGQASPTTEKNMITGIQVEGANSEPLNPVKMALSLEASFVARGFVGELEHLTNLIKAAIKHRGYAFIDILQPCVSFNKINTYQWYQNRVYKLKENDYDPGNYQLALKKAGQWGDEIPIGIFYKQKKEVFMDNFSQVSDKPLVEEKNKVDRIKSLYNEFS